MLRFVSAASSCLGGTGKRQPCCSRCLCLDLMLFCPASRMGVALPLQYLNTTAFVGLRACYLQSCSLHFTPSSTASHHSCCGSRFQSFWSGAFSLLGSSSCFSCSFHGFVPANPDMVIMYFHRSQLPLTWVATLFSLFPYLWFCSLNQRKPKHSF